MKKKHIAFVIVLALVLIASSVLMVTNRPESMKGEPSETETQTRETTAQTTEPLPFGVVENPFLDDYQETGATEATGTTEATEPQEETREPEATHPQKGNGGAGYNGEDGLVEPDVPETSPEKPAASPTEPPTEAPTAPKPQTEYEKFQNMNAQEQQDYMNSFGSVDDFFNWYNGAKEEYDASRDEIQVGGDSINMGDIITGKNG